MATDFSEVRRIGGSLCLDFVNTIAYRLGKHPLDHLSNSVQVLDWLVYADVLSPEEHERLALYAAAYPAEAQAFATRCRELREAAFYVLDAVAHQRAAPDAPARAIDAFLARGHYAIALAPVTAALTWQHDSPFDYALDLVLDSLVQLLSTTEHSQLRMCQADDCGWLFLDTSRTHQRRWCSMRGCGTRAKARRHYRRHVTAASA